MEMPTVEWVWEDLELEWVKGTVVAMKEIPDKKWTVVMVGLEIFTHFPSSNSKWNYVDMAQAAMVLQHGVASNITYKDHAIMVVSVLERKHVPLIMVLRLALPMVEITVLSHQKTSRAGRNPASRL